MCTRVDTCINKHIYFKIFLLNSSPPTPTPIEKFMDPRLVCMVRIYIEIDVLQYKINVWVGLKYTYPLVRFHTHNSAFQVAEICKLYNIHRERVQLLSAPVHYHNRCKIFPQVLYCISDNDPLAFYLVLQKLSAEIHVTEKQIHPMLRFCPCTNLRYICKHIKSFHQCIYIEHETFLFSPCPRSNARGDVFNVRGNRFSTLRIQMGCGSRLFSLFLAYIYKKNI